MLFTMDFPFVFMKNIYPAYYPTLSKSVLEDNGKKSIPGLWEGGPKSVYQSVTYQQIFHAR